MQFLNKKLRNKKNKGRDGDDDDDLDFDDGDEEEENSENEGEGTGGLLGKVLGRLKKGGGDELDADDEDAPDRDSDDELDADDEDAPDRDSDDELDADDEDAPDRDGGDDNQRDDQSGEDEGGSSAQPVKPEGVADVRSVGGSGGSLAPSGKPASGKGGKEAGKSGKPASSPVPDQNAEPAASGGAAPEESNNKDTANEGKSEKGGLDISLMDAFEEETHVDEQLKYLADTQDDVAAEDLAGELREFLAELEK